MELERKTINQCDDGDNDKINDKRRRMGLQKGADGRKFHQVALSLWAIAAILLARITLSS